MFVGEAPGAKEDELGVPFVGAAGKLLDELLGEVGLARSDVFISNVLGAGRRATATRCRPRSTTARGTSCARSSSSSRASSAPSGTSRRSSCAATRRHLAAARPGRDHRLGARAVRLYPLYHPAAALYTRSLLETLRADVARLPALLALPLPEQPERAGRGRARAGPSPTSREPAERRSRSRPRRASRGRRARRPPARPVLTSGADRRSAQRRQHPLAVRADRAERVGAADELQADDGRAGALHLADALDVLARDRRR